MTYQELYPVLQREFEKIAALRCGGYPRDDFEQDMWIELYEFVHERGLDGTIPVGRYAGMVLLEQTPQFVAVFCAGRARKHIHRNRFRDEQQVSLEAVFFVEEDTTPAGPLSEPTQASLIRRLVRASGGLLDALDVARLLEQFAEQPNGVVRQQAALAFLETGSLRQVAERGASYTFANTFRRALQTLAAS